MLLIKNKAKTNFNIFHFIKKFSIELKNYNHSTKKIMKKKLHNNALHHESKLSTKNYQKTKKQFFYLLKRQNVGRWYNKDHTRKEMARKIRQKNLIIFGFLLKICSQLEIKLSILATAICYLDTLISKAIVSDLKLVPVGLICLQLANKIGNSSNIKVNYKDIDQFLYTLGVAKYVKYEKIVFKSLDFNLHIVSCFDFIRFLLNEFEKNEYLFYEEVSDLKDAKKKFEQILLRLLSITLIDYQFYRFTSSATAVSVIMVARSEFGLKPWTEKMEKFTKYSQEDVKKVVNYLRALLKDDYVSDYFGEYHFLDIN